MISISTDHTHKRGNVALFDEFLGWMAQSLFCSMSYCLLTCFVCVNMCIHFYLSFLSHTVWHCSSGGSCYLWTHQDSPETVGGRSQCQPSEQGDDCECVVTM